MAVTYTSNIGLAKPSESELAQDWANTQKWADFNNKIVNAKSSFPLKAYTSSIIGPTTNPSLGSGAIYAGYIEFQGWIFGEFSLYFLDPGIVAGTGTGGYGIKLPTLVDNTFHNVGVLIDGPAALGTIGEGYYSDYSSIPLSGTIVLDVVRVGGIDYARPITETYTGKSVAWVGPGFPSAAAHGDGISGSFVYKKG